jgi:FKBP-type peptidyl-prolyl cis-trans isomerase SlyD
METLYDARLYYSRETDMQIAPHKVVLIHYTLTDEEGEVLDSSEGNDPLAFIQGAGNIISGLERALEGKVAGDRLNVRVEPEDAYGVRDDELIQSVPVTAFEGAASIEPGMQFHAETQDGLQMVTVLAVEGDEVVLDGNHPLAGIPLHFDVEIIDVRDASEEELSHGHVHGAGGHHH